MPEPADYSTEFANRLSAYGVEAKLIGALAALRYRASPRMTVDVDFLARDLTGLAARLLADGFDVEEFTEDGQPYLLYVRGGATRVDILLAETEYQRAALDRAEGDVITAEDVIVHKLIAGRPRDIDDIREILRSGTPLDWGYIEHWALAWDVIALWREIQSTS